MKMHRTAFRALEKETNTFRKVVQSSCGGMGKCLQKCILSVVSSVVKQEVTFKPISFMSVNAVI